MSIKEDCNLLENSIDARFCWPLQRSKPRTRYLHTRSGLSFGWQWHSIVVSAAATQATQQLASGLITCVSGHRFSSKVLAVTVTRLIVVAFGGLPVCSLLRIAKLGLLGLSFWLIEVSGILSEGKPQLESSITPSKPQLIMVK